MHVANMDPAPLGLVNVRRWRTWRAFINICSYGIQAEVSSCYTVVVDDFRRTILLVPSDANECLSRIWFPFYGSIWITGKLSIFGYDTSIPVT